MSIARALPICVAALCFAAPARADDLPDCANPIDQMEMSYCASIDYEKADKELNRIWPKVVAAARKNDEKNDEYVAKQAKSMGVPTTYEALLAAQRAWLKFRDAQCDYETYEVFGGTMESMVGSLCLARLTHERVKTLSQALESR